jgi:hypothetical protein
VPDLASLQVSGGRRKSQGGASVESLELAGEALAV